MNWFISHFDPFFILLGSLVGVLGLGFIYGAWRKKARHPLMLSAGWVLVAVGSALWIQAARFDTGLALATTLWMLVALAIVLANGQWQTAADPAGRAATSAKRSRAAKFEAFDEAKESNAAAPRINPPSTAVIKRALTNLMLAGPLAFAFALSVGSLIFPLAPWQEATRIIVGAMLTIIVWTVAMVWVVASTARARSALVLTVGTIASVLMLQWLQ